MRGSGRCLIAALLAILAGSSSAWAAEPAPDPCAVPDHVLTIDAALPRAYERLKRTAALPILVLNTANPRPAKAEPNYPMLLERDLAARLPGTKVSVIVRNAPGATTQAMLPVMDGALAAEHPALLVWQVGTVDAMRNIGPDGFGEAVAAGIDHAHAAGADIIVMDMQYSPQTSQLINFRPYLDYVEWQTQNADVFHFPRYEMMRYWLDEGELGFSSASREEMLRAYRFVHRCVGHVLADTVVTMIDRAKPTP